MTNESSLLFTVDRDGVISWEWVGRWWSTVIMSPEFSRGQFVNQEWLRWARRHLMLIQPGGYELRDYQVYGLRSCPLTWVRALWVRKLRYPLLRMFYYRPMVFLYRIGLAWWPESCRVSIKDIGKRPDSSDEYALWRRDRYWRCRSDD